MTDRRNKIIALLGVRIVIGLVILTVVFILSKRDKETQAPQIPDISQITPSLEATQAPLQNIRIVSSTPTNGAQNIPVDARVIVELNVTAQPENIIVEAFPPIQFQKSTEGTRLTLTHQQTFNTGTQYELTFLNRTNNDGIGVISFITTGPTPEEYPDTGPSDEIIDDLERVERETSPDVYLTNSTPFENEYFSISSKYISAGDGYFAFTATMKVEESQARQEINNWMLSTGLTQDQIDILDINFVKQ